MKNLEKIDKNFAVNTKLNERDIKFYNVKEKPFDLYGFYDNKSFTRLPKDVAENTNEGVFALYTNTAGGRVRFSTDSKYIAIYVKYPSVERKPQMPLTGIAGFDLYVFDGKKYEYHNTFIPLNDITDELEAITYFGDNQMRDITINFPLYNDVSEVYIGVSENSNITGGGKYINEKPVVYYGSSITQGGCASRPGNSYQAMISRRFNCDYINLGFSGNAKAEDVIAKYVASLDMCCFVYDYDHNAPDSEYLEKTHGKMYLTVRNANPDIPIICMSRPNLTDDFKKNKEIILDSIKKHPEDKNLYFIDGFDIYNFCGSDGLVDGIHPNDYGFYGMAHFLGELMGKIL